MRILLLSAVAMLIVAAATTRLANANSQSDRGEYAIGLWGDLPYSDVQAQVGVPNLIADMNSQKLVFTAHDGDLKAGSSECTDNTYIQALGYLNSLKSAAMFTPGDNDWTDCDRTPGYNSLAQLDKERKLFFSTAFSQGQKPMKQEVQSTPLCLGVSGPTPCVENRRWTFKGVTYATMNVQGSCNNLCDVAPDANEYAARNQANIAWLHDTFAQAKALNSAAVMLITQADPGFDLTDATRARYATRRRSPRPTQIRTVSRSSCWLCATRSPTSATGCLRARRFALLPHRQAAAELGRATSRELHARRNLRRPPGKRAQRCALA